MSVKVVLCGNCGGFGYTLDAAGSPVECGACNGHGFVTVTDEREAA